MLLALASTHVIPLQTCTNCITSEVVPSTILSNGALLLQTVTESTVIVTTSGLLQQSTNCAKRHATGTHALSLQPKHVFPTQIKMPRTVHLWKAAPRVPLVSEASYPGDTQLEHRLEASSNSLASVIHNHAICHMRDCDPQDATNMTWTWSSKTQGNPCEGLWQVIPTTC